MKNKEKILFFFIVLSFLLIINTVCFGVTVGTITGSKVRVREEASSSSKILFNLSKNEVVNVLEEKEEWYKILYNNEKEGWISKDYVSTESSEYEVTTLENINLKSLPLINSISIANVNKNQKITVIDNINGWFYVKYNETFGWVREEKLKGILKDPVIQENEVIEEDVEEPVDEPIEKPLEETNVEETLEQQPVKEQEEKIKILKYVYIDVSSVRVRKEASTTSEVIETTTEGNKIPVIGEDGDWYKIKIMDKIGYIRKDLVRDTETKEISRSETTTKIETVNLYKEENSKENTEQKQTTSNTQNSNEKAKSTTTEATQQTNENASSVVNLATQYVGLSYVYGGSSPSIGFDCSGLTKYVFKQFGVTLPHSASAQSGYGIKVDKSNLIAGDLVFFSQDNSGSNISHVGIYVENGTFVHACCPDHGVRISSLSSSYYLANYVTARRISL